MDAGRMYDQNLLMAGNGDWALETGMIQLYREADFLEGGLRER